MHKLSSKVQNIELKAFSDTVGANFKKFSSAQKNPFLSRTMQDLQDVTDKMKIVFRFEIAHNDLKEKDKLRGIKFMNAKKLSEGYSVIPIAEIREKNAPIKALFDKCKGLTAESYMAETGLIKAFMANIANLSENVEALTGMKEALEEFYQAQKDFEEASRRCVDKAVSKEPCATKYKWEILKIINDKLVGFLTAMVISEDADCFEFAKYFEAEINNLNLLIQRRGHRKAKAATEDNKSLQEKSDEASL